MRGVQRRVVQHLQVRNSVTRFGEILPLWQGVKSVWAFFKVNLVFGKILNPLSQKGMLLGKFVLLQIAKY